MIERWELRYDDLTPDERGRYEERLKTWDERLRPLQEANRRSEQLTSKDFNIRVGPCDELDV